MTQTIEQLTARIAELEAEVERLKAECKEFAGYAKDGTIIAAQQQMKLAAEQLNNKRLREALEAVIKVHGYESGIPLAFFDGVFFYFTEALDKHVAEKVKEAESRTGNQSPCYTIARDIAVRMWEKHYKTDAPNWEPLDDFMGVLSQISNMLTGLGNVEKITRQRDLAVEALDRCAAHVRPTATIFYEEIVEAINAIKESE